MNAKPRAERGRGVRNSTPAAATRRKGPHPKRAGEKRPGRARRTPGRVLACDVASPFGEDDARLVWATAPCLRPLPAGAEEPVIGRPVIAAGYPLSPSQAICR
jgi:hypothetical protein